MDYILIKGNLELKITKDEQRAILTNRASGKDSTYISRLDVLIEHYGMNIYPCDIYLENKKQKALSRGRYICDYGQEHDQFISCDCESNPFVKEVSSNKMLKK